jgi:hypothetical protein
MHIIGIFKNKNCDFGLMQIDTSKKKKNDSQIDNTQVLKKANDLIIS